MGTGIDIKVGGSVLPVRENYEQTLHVEDVQRGEKREATAKISDSVLRSPLMVQVGFDQSVWEAERFVLSARGEGNYSKSSGFSHFGWFAGPSAQYRLNHGSWSVAGALGYAGGKTSPIKDILKETQHGAGGRLDFIGQISDSVALVISGGISVPLNTERREDRQAFGLVGFRFGFGEEKKLSERRSEAIVPAYVARDTLHRVLILTDPEWQATFLGSAYRKDLSKPVEFDQIDFLSDWTFWVMNPKSLWKKARLDSFHTHVGEITTKINELAKNGLGSDFVGEELKRFQNQAQDLKPTLLKAIEDYVTRNKMFENLKKVLEAYLTLYKANPNDNLLTTYANLPATMEKLKEMVDSHQSGNSDSTLQNLFKQHIEQVWGKIQAVQQKKTAPFETVE